MIACVAGREQAVTDAGLVNLDAEEVEFRVLCGLLHQRLAVAEADFEHHGGGAPEQRAELQQLLAERHAEFRPEFLECTLLRGGEASRPADETAYRPVPRGDIGARSHSGAL